MASKNTPAEQEDREDLGTCQRCGAHPATQVTTGGGAHSPIAYCDSCWKIYQSTRGHVRGR